MKFNLLTYFIVFLSSFLFGQDKVELIINPQSVEVGEIFSITITSTEPGNYDVENLPSSFIQDYSFNQGSNQEMNYSTGEVKVVYFITYTGMITKSGDYTIGPAFLKTGNKTYKSNTVDIKVSKKQNMSYGTVTAQQLNSPAFGLIECNKKEIYEGEPLLVAAKVYSYYEPSHISGYQTYEVNSTVLKNPVGNSNDIKVLEENFKGKKLYAFNYDKNVIFPDAVGSFQIEPFKMNLHQNYKSYPIVSSGLRVNVKPLPANPPSDFIGAVGHFSLSASIDTNNIKQGEVVRLTLTIKGSGNLQNILEPHLLLPKGLLVYGDPIPTENFIMTSKGADGEVSFEYNIQVTEFGNIKLPANSIAYFDPEQEKYIQINTDELEINVKKNNAYHKNDTRTIDQKDQEMIVHNTSIRTEEKDVRRNDLFGTTVFWTGVSVPIMSAFFFLFFVGRRRKNEDQIRHKETVREKTNALNGQLEKLKQLSSGEDNDAFLALAENIVRSEIAVRLGKEDAASVTKGDVFDYLGRMGQKEAEDKARSLFSVVERSRYGFGMEKQANKSSLYSDVEQIIDRIRS